MTLDELIAKLVELKAAGYPGDLEVYYVGKNSPVTGVGLYRDLQDEINVELQGR